MSVIHAPRKPTLDARTLIFPIGIGAVLLVIFLRLWYIQVVRAPELIERAQYFRNTVVEKLAPRGLVFDRNGEILAGVRSRFVVTAVPAEVRQNPWVLGKLAAMLQVDQDKLAQKVQDANWKPWMPTTIYVGVPVETASRILEAGDDLPGIGVESQPMRYYPDPISFSHILGYVWTRSEKDEKRLAQEGLKPATYVGKMGVEYVYEKELMGVPGADHMEVDAKRHPTRFVGRDNPIPGDQLILTLDSDLQKMALSQLSGRVGAVVAIDPQNGEVLCMVSSPSYDASLFDNGVSKAEWEKLQNDPSNPFLNRAVSGAYAPGSTFKLVTSLAAAETGHFDPNHVVFCPGYYQVGDRRSKCLGRHGPITFHEALVKSCNTYFSDLAVAVGPEAIRSEAFACGLGAPTGIDLRSESSGRIPTDEWVAKRRLKWYAGDTVNMGIGQGAVATTPLQMANLVALVGTEGTQYRPHFLKAIRQPDGTLQNVDPIVAHQVKAPAVFWADLKSAMIDVIQSGTARLARIDGVVWAGKTGSAEHGHETKTHSWFVGFAPADHPRIAICVLAEQAGHGGEISAPIAGALVRHYLAEIDKPASKASADPKAAAEALVSPSVR